MGPQVGEEPTVMAFGETCLVAKTDPITFATDEIAKIFASKLDLSA